MVSSTSMEGSLSNISLSTVVPANMTAENTVHNLTNTDLALKLHYLKGVYFFKKEAAQGLTIPVFKSAMFPLLSLYYPVAGRIRRRPEDGRPFVKCNDSGVRIVEADAVDHTMDEWLEMNKDVDQLAYHDHVLGPDLGFSPLVFMQFTWFKCGGLSVGLSWAHILGDAFSASTFINTWAQIVEGNYNPPQIPFPSNRGNKKFQFPLSIPEKSLSLKKVDPVGDCWSSPSYNKLVTTSLHISAEKLEQIMSKTKAKPFQALTATIWKALARVRGESEPKIVTICEGGCQGIGIVGNGQSVSTVEVGFTVSSASVSDLVESIVKKKADESGLIEESLEGEDQNSDFILYGTNLTFVNLEGIDIYGLELQGHKPIVANYTVAGVGDEGVVLVLPVPNSRNGRMVTLVLPNDQAISLSNDLKKEFNVM